MSQCQEGAPFLGRLDSLLPVDYDWQVQQVLSVILVVAAQGGCWVSSHNVHFYILCRQAAAFRLLVLPPAWSLPQSQALAQCGPCSRWRHVHLCVLCSAKHVLPG